MGRRRARRPALSRIHSSVEPDIFQRLTALADREESSLARIVKLAVIEFLDRRRNSAKSTRETRAMETKAADVVAFSEQAWVGQKTAQ